MFHLVHPVQSVQWRLCPFLCPDFCPPESKTARSTTHFPQPLDELSRLNIELISVHENLDTGGVLSRAIVIIVTAIAELEKNLIREREKAGMRRAQLKGRRIGRRPIAGRSNAILHDRSCGRSLTRDGKIPSHLKSTGLQYPSPSSSPRRVSARSRSASL